MFGLLPAVALALLAVDVQAMKLDFLRFPRRALESAEEHALIKRAPTYITNYTLPNTNYTYVFFIYNAYLFTAPSIPLFTSEPFHLLCVSLSLLIPHTGSLSEMLQPADDQVYRLLYRYHSQASLCP
jgi:hypothetical protein